MNMKYVNASETYLIDGRRYHLMTEQGWLFTAKWVAKYNAFVHLGDRYPSENMMVLIPTPKEEVEESSEIEAGEHADGPLDLNFELTDEVWDIMGFQPAEIQEGEHGKVIICWVFRGTALQGPNHLRMGTLANLLQMHDAKLHQNKIYIPMGNKCPATFFELLDVIRQIEYNNGFIGGHYNRADIIRKALLLPEE